MSAERITAFTAGERAAVLAVGIVGVLIAGLQPQLLGALAHEGRLSASALGNVATAELLAMGIAAGGAGLLLSGRAVRGATALALLAIAALDLATVRADGAAILAVRALAGLAEGLLVWITICMIVRTAHPARWSGVYLMLQTGVQLALATVLSIWVIPAGGSAAGFTWLGVATACALLAVPLMPRRYDPLTEIGQPRSATPARGWIALASIAFWLAFVVAVWVYVEPLALQRSLAHDQVAIIAPLSLLMQMVGAGAAILLAGRVRALPVLVACALANLALLAVMGGSPSAATFVAATAAFGFLWLFAMPFQLPIVIAADPSRSAAELVGGAQLAGASIGPFLAARLVSDADVGGVLWFGAGALGVALALSFAAIWGTGVTQR